MSMTNIPPILSDSSNQYPYLDSLQAKLQLLKHSPSFPKTFKKKQSKHKQSQSISSSGVKRKFQIEKIKKYSLQKQKSAIVEDKSKISKILIKNISSKKPLTFFSDRLLGMAEIDKLFSSKTVQTGIFQKFPDNNQTNYQQEKMRKSSLYILGVIRKQNQKLNSQSLKKNKKIINIQQNKKKQKTISQKYASNNLSPTESLKTFSNSNLTTTLKRKYLLSVPGQSYNQNIRQNHQHFNSQKRVFPKVIPKTAHIEAKIKFQHKNEDNIDKNLLENNFILQPWEGEDQQKLQT